jgi:Kef-type K+ transport system membrane component KefB
MDNIWFVSALWIGLALIAASMQAWIAVSVALLEIMIGAIAGNLVDMTLTPWINYLAGFGAILLTFLAGAEIDAKVIRRHFGSTMAIGAVGFFAPYLGVLAWAHFGSGWPWPQAQIAGIALSTTSVAVVYAVMVETGFNDTEIGKVILAACFINDIGTVLALGLVFANYNFWLLGFAGATAFALLLLPRVTPWFFARIGPRVSEPQIKFVLVILFLLGGLANTAKSEAVLPAYLIGMVLAPVFLADRQLMHRTRVIAFTVLTPFYFLKAGSLVRAADRRCGGAYRDLSCRQNDHQIRGHPAADAGVPVRAERGDVHDVDDVDRPDLRVDLGAVRPHQSHHRRAPIYDSADRRDRQRGGADIDCAAVVPARFQAARRRDTG